MRIVNVRGLPANDPSVVYCGRPYNGWVGSPLGNPFVVGRDGTRDEVIRKYRGWLWQQLQIAEACQADWYTGRLDAVERRAVEVFQALDRLREDSVLGCWCAPQSCHCDVIVRAWLWLRGQAAAK